MKPADVFIAVLVAVIWGSAFVLSRIALDFTGGDACRDCSAASAKSVFHAG